MEIRVNRIGRAGRGGGTGSDLGGSGGDIPPGSSILTITDDSTVALVTTATPHGLSSGAHIVIVGTSVAGYNGLQTLVTETPPSSTTFHIGAFTSNSFGGYWVRA